MLIFLIVEDKRNRYSFLKVILDNLIEEGKSKIYTALKNLEKTQIIEIIKNCPYCKKLLLPEGEDFERKKT